jgi:hypothetical protein
MIELLLPYGFDTLEYSRVKATIGICTLADYYVAKKFQHPCGLDGGWYPPGTSMGGLQRRSVGLSSGLWCSAFTISTLGSLKVVAIQLASSVRLLPVDRCHIVIRIPQYLTSYHTTNSGSSNPCTSWYCQGE